MKQNEDQEFLQECLVYLGIHEGVYNNDAKKIAFVLSFMMEKEAALWKEQYIQSLIGRLGFLLTC